VVRVHRNGTGGIAVPVDPRLDEGGRELAGVSALTFLTGVWLVLAPFALDYPATGTKFDGSWNDLVVGSAIAVVALVRIALPARTAALGPVNVGLGVWLVVAPTALAYNRVFDASPATWNDIVVGVTVMLLAAVGTLIDRRRRPT
jgi:hypothetical protein